MTLGALALSIKGFTFLFFKKSYRSNEIPDFREI